MVPVPLQVRALTKRYYSEGFYYNLILFRKCLSLVALGLQNEKERVSKSDQRGPIGRKRESKRPPGVCGNHQADVALVWRMRPVVIGAAWLVQALVIEVWGEG